MTVVPHSSLLYLFHVGSTRGQCAPHDHQAFHVSLSSCVAVCVRVRVQRTHDLVQCACVHWHAKNTYMYVPWMWGSMHLNARGGPSSQVTDRMCSRDCCDVLSPSLQEVLLQLKTMQKMTRAHACSSSAHCLSCPCSLHRVAVPTMGEEV